MDFQQRISTAMGILPNSKEFAMVMRAIEIERQYALGKKGIMISYPLSAVDRYNTTTGGITNINFKSGFLKKPDGTQVALDGMLEKVRSLLLFCSDADALIFLDGKQLIADHTLWHSFEDIDIERLDIQFPTDRIPDSFAFGFIANDKPNHQAKNSLFISHDIRTVTGTTTDNDVVVMQRHVACYDDMSFVIKNTHSTNSLYFIIEQSADGLTWYTADAGSTEGSLTPSSISEFHITIKYHFIRMRIRSQVPASPATFVSTLQLAR